MKKQNENVNQVNHTKIILRILLLIRPYYFIFFLSLLLAAMIVATTLLLPIFIGNAIDIIIGMGNVDFMILGKIIGKMLIIICITCISQWTMSKLHNDIVFKIVRDLRKKAFWKLQRLPIKYIDSKKHGEMISRIVSDVETFSDGAMLGFSQFFTGILTIFITLIFILRLNGVLAFIVLIITPLSLFVSTFVAKKSFVYFKNQSEKRGMMTGIVDEMVGGITTVKAYGMEKTVFQEFQKANQELQDTYLQATFYSSISNPATRFVNSLVYASVGVAGAYFVILGQLSVGALVSILSYATQYTKPFNEISGVIAELQNSIACAGRIFQLLDEEEMIPDSPNATIPSSIEGNIKIKEVDFSYSKEKKFIEDLNIEAYSGQRVAIVGPTGCGKTTIINLIMRFYEVDRGNITLDREDIKNIQREAYMKGFGMVLQETWLSHGTVRENIAMAKPSASMEEIKKAAKEAYADTFIQRLPDGYDTMIRKGGENFSAGQRQLICIARAMLAKPSVLILDEATSSIDTRTEVKVQQAFQKLMQGRTSFVVAHRLSTIQQADMILVMKDGIIIERGKHQELLEKNGFYKKLYQSQFEKI